MNCGLWIISLFSFHPPRAGADPGLFRGEWLGALEIHSFDIPLNIDNICEAFKRKHPRKLKCAVLLFCIIRFDYLGFVKDYIHERMKNYIMYMAMYVQANSTERKDTKKD